jgi:modification methylase
MSSDQPTRPRPYSTRPMEVGSVWPTGDRTPYTQLADSGYLLPATAHDTAAIPPDIAAYAITTYTRPGDVVLDPDCGAGTVVVEAARADRRGAGLTGSRHWHQVTTANLTATGTTGTVLHTTTAATTNPRGGPSGIGPTEPVGPVDLVLTALRSRSARPDPRRGSPSPDPDSDLLLDPVAGVRAVLAGCRPLLHPGSRVLVVCRTRRPDGYLLDLSTAALAAAQAAGLVPVQRCIALLAPVTGERLTIRASLAHRRATARHQHVTGHPIALAAHLTVLAFTPAQPAPGQTTAGQPPTTPSASPARRPPRRSHPGAQPSHGPDHRTAPRPGSGQPHPARPGVERPDERRWAA